jgi:hypothetical protein
MNRINQFLTRMAIVCLSFVLSGVALAQEGGGGADIKVDVNKGGNNWYTSPWVWVIGAAVFILLLVALLRGNKRD